MTVQPRPVVLTAFSASPASDPSAQGAAAWADRGLRVLALPGGTPPAGVDLCPAAAEATGQIRLVAALAAAAQLTGQGGTLVLTRPEVFPAIRSAGVVDYWRGLAGAVALMAERCALVETAGRADYAPDRGTVAALVLGPGRIAALQALLADCPTAAGLAFGTPAAWALLAAAVRHPRVGGRLTDSGVLLRPWQPAGDPEAALAPARADLARLTGLPKAHATPFSARLETLFAADCGQPEGPGLGLPRDRARAAFLALPVPPRPSAAAVALAHDCAAQAPWIGWRRRLSALAALAEAELAAPAPNLGRARAFFAVNPDPEAGFAQDLQAQLFCLAAARRAGRARPPREDRAALAALAAFAEGPRRRLAAARLFGDRLVGQGVFDPALLAYLVESCDTEDDLALMTEIAAHIRSPRHAAA